MRGYQSIGRMFALLVIAHSMCVKAEPAVAQQEVQRPKYGPAAIRLYHAREYIQNNRADDFWALIPYYVPQENDRACSTASVAMLINALRAERELAADEQLVTHASLLIAVGDSKWKRQVAANGEGVTLGELGEYVKRALVVYKIAGARVEVVHFADASADNRARLHRLLAENERSSRDFLVANFLQSALTSDPEGNVGHIAPLAAFDEKNKRVLVLDPDRQWYEPYWVSEATLLAAMATLDKASGRSRGLVRVSVAR